MKTILFTFAFFLNLHLVYGQAGQFDPSFGNKGIVTTDMGTTFNYVNTGDQLLRSPDGSIYMVAEVAGLTLITKKKADGSADLSYGKNGISTAVPVYAPHGAFQADGKIVVAGYTANTDGYINTYDFDIARFKTDGTPDSTFGTNGLQITDLVHFDEATGIAIQADGKIVVVGWTNEYYSAQSFLCIVRYNPDGSLDNTFNLTGTVVTDFGGFTYASAVAFQSDGKILVAGYGYPGTGINSDFMVARYNPGGTLDNTFSDDGVATADLGDFEIFPDMAIQSDGKIVLAGYTGDGNDHNKFGLARFNTDGSLDDGFDGDGMLITDFGVSALAKTIAVQPDGKIIAAGNAGEGNNHDFAIARYNTDGSPDISFSGDGLQISDLNISNDFINSITLLPDGKLLALGYTVSGSAYNIAYGRYDIDGTPDNSFGQNGFLTDHVNQGSTFYNATAVQNDGKVVTAGYTWNGSDYDFAIVRYNIDGSQDNSFAGDGKQTTDFGASDDKASAMVITPDGKILVAGSAGGNFALARYNPDGTPDLGFDGDGLQTTDFGAVDGINALSIQPDGKIVAAGTALARYTNNGALDLSFDGDGRVITPFHSYDVGLQSDGKIVLTGDDNEYSFLRRYNTDGTADNTFGFDGRALIGTLDFTRLIGKSLAIQSDDKIVVGGYYELRFRTTAASFLLLRLNADGSPDLTFNGGGIIYTGIHTRAYANSLLLQSDNRIILAGSSYNGSSNDFSIARYNTDGTLDANFADHGVLVSPTSVSDDGIAAIAIGGNSLFAAGYGQYPGNFGVVAKYLLEADGGPLPVSLMSFNGVLRNKATYLQWQTASEQNLSAFIVERSADRNKFLAIGNVSAKGSSNSKTNYSWVDPQPATGINYYRLKMVDRNGKFNYSRTVAVSLAVGNFSLKVFPNPVQNTLFISASGENENAVFQLTDTYGRKLKEVTTPLNGNINFSMDVASLPRGVYQLQLYTSAKTETMKFIKQ